jgi:hypothetical protein
MTGMCAGANIDPIIISQHVAAQLHAWMAPSRKQSTFAFHP